jgi:hypothetical protein
MMSWVSASWVRGAGRGGATTTLAALVDSVFELLKNGNLMVRFPSFPEQLARPTEHPVCHEHVDEQKKTNTLSDTPKSQDCEANARED